MDKELYYEGHYLGKAHVADTFIERFMGYMNRTKPHHEAIIITPCNSIHTFFMRFDIDVLFVDRDLCVLKKIESLKPRRIIMPIHNAVSVIETAAGGFAQCREGRRLDEKYVE